MIGRSKRRKSTEGAVDETRAIIDGLESRRPFAPSLPAAASGGWAVGGAVALLSSIVLLLGLSPTPPSGATAHELVVMLRDGWRAGVSGPLWSALAVQVEGLPFGPSAVWRITLLSALPTALSAGLLAVWLRQRDIGRRAAVCAGLLFAFALPVWQSAVLPGAVPFATMLSLLALVLIEEGTATGATAPRLLGWGTLGLATLQGPLALGGALGVATVIALPRMRGAIRRAAAPSFFGGPLGSALAFVVGGIGAFLLGGGLPAMLATYTVHPAGWSPALPVDAIAEAGWLTGPTGLAAALGLLLLWRRHPGDAGALTLLATVPVGIALLLGARGSLGGDARLFALAIPVSFAAVAALAAAAIDSLLQRFAATPSPRAHLLTTLAALLPLAVIGMGAPLADRSQASTGEEWARAVLRSLPDDAVLFTAPDPRGGLLEWTQLVARVRPDILVADPDGRIDARRSPILALDPVPPTAAATIGAVRSLTERPIFSLTPVATDEGRWQPWGLVWRWAPATDAVASESNEAWEAIGFRSLPRRPTEVRTWIEEELRRPLPDRTERRIAADYFQALARRDGRLSQIGPWATILDHLTELRGGPATPGLRLSPGHAPAKERSPGANGGTSAGSDGPNGDSTQPAEASAPVR